MESVVLGPSTIPMSNPTLPHLLLVDDDPALLKAMARALGGSYTVTTAGSANEAMLILLASNKRFDAIISDLYMIGSDGAQLYEEVLAKMPKLARKMLFMSGGGLPTRLAEFAKDKKVLMKPVNVVELRAALGV